MGDDRLLERARVALRPLADSLEADGYSLAVESAAEGLVLSVAAGPAACAECLVPKSLLHGMVATALASADVDVDADRLVLRYPPEHHSA